MRLPPPTTSESSFFVPRPRPIKRGWLRTFTRRFVLSVRTERALRFIFPLPLAIWLSYDNVLGTNFGYLVVVLYTVFSALMPPSPASINLLLFIGFPGTILGLGMVTGLLNMGMAGCSDGLVLLVYGCFCLLCSTLRTGTLASLMTIGLFALIYSLDQALAQTYTVVKQGAEVGFGMGVLQLLAYRLKDVIYVLKNREDPLSAKLLVILEVLDTVKVFPPTDPILDISTGSMVVHDGAVSMPFPTSLVSGDDSKYFDQASVDIVGRPGIGVFAVLNFDKWFNRLLWFAQGRFGIVYGGVVNGLMAVALVALAVYLPPPRFMKSLFRAGCQDGVDTLRRKHTAMILDCGLGNERDFHQLGNFCAHNKFEEKRGSVLLSYREKQGCDCRCGREKKEPELPVSRLASKVTALRAPMLLSMFEQLLSSPMGVNTFPAAPEVLRGIVHGAIQTSVLEKMSLTGKSRMLRIWSGHPKSLSGELEIDLDIADFQVRRWLSEVAFESVRLQTVTQLAISIEARINKDDGQKLLIEDCFQRLDYERWRLTRRQREFASILNRETARRLHQKASSSQISDAYAWLNQFALTFIDTPLQLSEAVQGWLQAQRTRRFRAFLLSIVGFLAPLGLFLLAWFGPWVRAVCYPFTRRRATSEFPPSIMEQSYGHRSVRLGRESTTPRESPRDEMWLWPLQNQGEYVFSENVRKLKTHYGRVPIQHMYKLWMCIRFALGCTALMALIIYVPEWANLNITDVQRLPTEYPVTPSFSLPVIVSFDFLEKSQTAGWTMLGFLTAFVITWQGTIKRSMLRLVGVLVGSFLGWLCMCLFSDGDNVGFFADSGGWTGAAWGQAAWLMITNFIIVWLSCNPVSPASGFHPSWGYAAQVMTYQQTIIICESHLGQNTRDEIVLERLAGQGVGILTAAVVSCVIVPCDVNRTFAIYLSNCVHVLTFMVLPLAELSSICMLRSDPDAVVERWLDVYKTNMGRLNKHLENLTILKADNALFQEVPKLRTSPLLLILHDSMIKMQIIRHETFNILTALLQAEESSDTLPPLDEHPLASPVKGGGAFTSNMLSSLYDEEVRAMDNSRPQVMQSETHGVPPPSDESFTRKRSILAMTIDAPKTDNDEWSESAEKFARSIYDGKSRDRPKGGFKSNGDMKPELWARLESDESAYEIVAQSSPVVLAPRTRIQSPRVHSPRVHSPQVESSSIHPPRRQSSFTPIEMPMAEPHHRDDEDNKRDTTYEYRPNLNLVKHEVIFVSRSSLPGEIGIQTDAAAEETSDESISAPEALMSMDELRKAMTARADGDVLMSVLRCLERLHILLENVVRNCPNGCKGDVVTATEFEEAMLGGIQFCNSMVSQMNAKTAVLRMHFQRLNNREAWTFLIALQRRSAFLHFLLVELQELSKLSQVITTLHFRA